MSPTQSDRVRKASRERRAQQKEDLRQAILAEASKILYEKGYEGFSLRQLAERIGYSATTIYLYFEDKDALLITLVEERFGKLLKATEEAMTTIKDPLERIRFFGDAYLEFGLSDPAFFRGVYLQRPDLLVRALGPERVSLNGHNNKTTLQEAIDAGIIPPCNLEDVSNAMWAAIHGLVTLTVTIPKFSPEQIQGMKEALTNLVLKGLRS